MRKLIPIFVAGFFFSTHLALLAYINSSMLSQFVDEKSISIIFTAASTLSLVLVFIAPRIVRALGNSRFISIVALLSASLLILLGKSSQAGTTVPIFIAYFSLNTVILYCLDIYLEHYSKKNHIGNIRGEYLTICNLGWIMSPYVSGILTSNYSFNTVYFIAALSLLCALVIIVLSQHKFQDNHYHPHKAGAIFAGLKHAPEIRRIITLNFLLQLFFAWMVIYMPLYLHSVMNFNIGQMGIIFTVMLLPFVIFQYPAGKIADGMKNGEKKFIIFSLFLSGLTTLALMTIREKSVLTFALVLFTTRIGASILEVMFDSYFFKRVSDADAGVIGLYRNMLPLAYIIGPIIAGALLTFISYKSLFILLGILLFAGALYAMRIPKKTS